MSSPEDSLKQTKVRASSCLWLVSRLAGNWPLKRQTFFVLSFCRLKSKSQEPASLVSSGASPSRLSNNFISSCPHMVFLLCVSPNFCVSQSPPPRRAAVRLDYSHLTSLFEFHQLCQNLMFWYRHALAFWELELQCLNWGGQWGPVEPLVLQNPVSPPQHRWLSSGSSEFENEPRILAIFADLSERSLTLNVRGVSAGLCTPSMLLLCPFS